MYKEFETEISYKYLKEVIHNLKEPICIMGGWAVFFHVNHKFEKAQGRPYLGSRDIDLGFHMNNDMKDSILAQTIIILKDKLNFNPLSFRFMKEIHTETGQEIKEGKAVPSYFIFPMYIDLTVDSIPKDFKKKFGFNPIDEPLLKKVFNSKEFTVIKEFDKKLLLPNPKLLLTMKISSLPDRDKEHKKIKDLCDIFALVWYSNINPQTIDLSKYTKKNNLIKCFQSIVDKDYEKAAIQMGHTSEEVRRVISLILLQ